MNLRRFNSDDYTHLCSWWEKHNHPVLPKSSLSPIGIVAELDGQLVAVSFLYVMYGCDLAQIAWTTTNPDVGLKTRYRGVDTCLKGLIETAKQNKRTNIICFSNSTGLTKLIKKYGLNTGSKHDLLAGVIEVN